jgi:hypothetical protein
MTGGAAFGVIPVLRRLAAHPEGLTSADFQTLMRPELPRQRKLSQTGGILRRQESLGRVTRGASEPGSKYANASPAEQRYTQEALKKDHPLHVWWITDTGREYLEYVDTAPEREASAQRVADKLLAAAIARDQALASAALSCSRNTPRHERRETAAHLRELGCTLEEIGMIFGVTREMIRKDLLPWVPSSPRTRRLPGQRFVRALPLNDVLAVTFGKRTIYLTAGEARELADVIVKWTEASYDHTGTHAS